MFRASRIRVALAILCVLAGDAPLSAADSKTAVLEKPEVAAAIEVFDAWADWTVRHREQPGVSIGIVYDQDLIWSKGYGLANLNGKTPATPATAYRIASISKVFTATALLQLRDAGKLQLDDPVSKWIPELKPAKVDSSSPVITIRHLLTHTSGIPREVDGTYWNDMSFPSREQMLVTLNRMGVVMAPEKEWKYSNVALSLAGYVVEAASGEPYAEYVARHILSPLGMSGTRVIPSSDMPTLATGYGIRIPGKPRRVEPFLNAAYMVPAANLASTVQDLAKFASLQFRDGAAGGAQILKGTTLGEMHRVQWLQPDWKSGWGLGWGVSRRDDKVRIGHGGAVPGHRTAISLLPAEKFGVIVLTNAEDGKPHLYVNQAYAIVAPVLAKAVAVEATEPKADPAWQKFAGVYSFEDDEIHVAILDGKLTIFDPSEDNPWEGKVTLEPVSGNVFRMKDGDQEGETVTFVLDASGRVMRFEAPGYYLSRRP